MNDAGLEDSIQDASTHVTHSLREHILRNERQSGSQSKSKSASDTFREELKVDEEEEDIGFFAPQRWWFTSTAFPLIAGTFGPLASLFSVCALVQTWRIQAFTGKRITDPHWLIALNVVSLVSAIAANLLLLFNFARRVRYMVAQPSTIVLWYLSSLLLIVPLGIIHRSSDVLSQSYFYALLSAILYGILSTLLLLHLIFSQPPFSAYPASFATLTIPQRTLMLQTISFTLYLALGAGIFSALEQWDYCDGLFWATYTVLTIGLGSDFPLDSSAGRGVVIPYSTGGILLLGIVVGSVRGLVLERGGVKMAHRRMAKERAKHLQDLRRGDSDEELKQEFETMRKVAYRAGSTKKYTSLLLALFVFILVWFLGAMSSQNWGYGTSLYFTYIALTTIGYGDLFPESNAGKSFFVLWTLIAVPSVTILISNIGNTLVTVVQKGTLWLGQLTLLPERSLNRSRAGREQRKGFWPLRSPASVERAVGSEKAREVDEGAVPPSGTDAMDAGDRGVREDIEKLGGAVETLETAISPGGSHGLAAQITREIKLVARDLGQQPPVEYAWEDWKRWIGLLQVPPPGGAAEGSRDGQDGLKALKSSSSPLHKTSKSNSRRNDMGEEKKDWIWLGDHGPLFSGESEAKWILGKLCERLEQVLMEEAEKRGNHDGGRTSSSGLLD
ncbi:hypothetical protein BDP27DRAFT_1382742 [Rhodocollybia butyracea]|uniref:Potassium channel domain-containing protein n=1 Tax=Rhodocollybia butyracea TaxID=206335 RepID=A0A9P5PWJ2_9AGAR|nr:hypothetical protein BDP27DRAFT_1382742 [Rhodocollybia butyracea]